MRILNNLTFLLLLLFFIVNQSFGQLNTSRTYNIKKSNVQYYFVVTQISEQDSNYYQDKIFKIDIYNPDMITLMQSINLNMEYVQSDFFPIIDSTNFEDINSDGYIDLALPSDQSGAMGRNEYINVYLYYPLENEFRYNEHLSNVCNLRVNKEDGTIEEFIFNGGDPNYTCTKYEFINNSLVIKKIVNQHFDVIETSYFENGNFLYKEVDTLKEK